VLDKTFTSVIVDFPPGARAAPHRHGEAFVYAYALEGTVRSQLDDTPVSTFHPGENWVEHSGAQHILTEKTSSTERARLLVVFVADTGAERKVDDPPGNRGRSGRQRRRTPSPPLPEHTPPATTTRLN
jgi:quercetin dioxygenase-like cupin family protein